MNALGRSVTRVLGAALTLAAGVAAGLFTASRSTGREPPLGGVRSGPWTTWPAAAGADADPYARAVAARDGRLWLAPSAGVRFIADTDSDGQPLVGRCDYTVLGTMPAAQTWTLTLLDPQGYVLPGSAERKGFTADEVLRGLDGDAAVVIAPEARPGNWLPAGRLGRFRLMLDLYDTPLGVALRMGAAAPALPRIARGACP